MRRGKGRDERVIREGISRYEKVIRERV